MSISSIPSIFESFNARALKPAQVAESFVPSQHFEQLIKRNHTIIIGPRGSGKTTLLKMLQQPALEAWQHKLAQTYRSHIDYTSVFIATDLSWGAQIEALGEGMLDEESHKLLGEAAFTTHILRSLVTTMLNRVKNAEGVVNPFRRVNLSDNDEAKLVRTISDAWHIKPTIPSLLSLKHALSIRLSRIREIARGEVTLGEVERATRLTSIDFLKLHFVESAAIAVESFNDLVNEEDGKWALLFDELELAPSWIQDELIRSLRSTDARFLYKLAMSPFSASARLLEMKTGLSPAPDQDFEQIALWYAEKNHSYKFCQHLWESMLKERDIDEKSPTEVLGRSYFETYHDEWVETGSAYSPNSKISHRFISLNDRDITFRNYLKKKEIDPKHLHLITKDKMDSIVRKIAPLVALREFYRAPDRRGVRKIKERTRKSAILYAGAESLFAVSEGNPRWFIAIMTRLLDNWQVHSKMIQRGSQAKEMIKAAQRFAAMLRTIPTPPGSLSKSNRGVLSLINTIGQFFHNVTVIGDFIAEPPATFTIDANTNDDVILMLEQALNAGAIVYIPDDNSNLILTNLRGKRFRISYLLAPLFGLPLRLGVDMPLSKILTESNMAKINMAELPFGEVEEEADYYDEDNE